MIPENIDKIRESQYLRFIDITPTASTPTWAVIGIGVEEGGAATEYNPQIDTIKWIIEDVARNDHKSNQKQASVTQKVYKNDPCFEFVNAGRDVMNYKTHILEVDMWDANNGSYSAKFSDGLIAITSYNGDEIEYDLYYNGDPIKGTVTVSDYVPEFTPVTSL